MEKEQADDVAGEAEAANDDYEHRVRDLCAVSSACARYGPSTWKKRLIASSMMLTHSATRKTPLISAPRISARCHPYEFVEVEGEVASLIAYSATINEMMSLSDRQLPSRAADPTDLSMWNESATSARDPTQ